MLIIAIFHHLHCEDSYIPVLAWRVIARTDFILVFWITIKKPVLESKLRRVEMCLLSGTFRLTPVYLHQTVVSIPIMYRHLWSFQIT